MTSTTEYDRTGIGCYVRVQLGMRMYYSGMMMYTNLYIDKYFDRNYGEK